jgi:hypothetical protein
MSRPFAQPKVQEVLVATYTPPFIETFRVDVLQRPVELTTQLGSVDRARRRGGARRDHITLPATPMLENRKIALDELLCWGGAPFIAQHDRRSD